MYSSLPSFVLGFHGCDKTLADELVAGKSRLKPSRNDYDWLGHGIYFWENNPQRALEYAQLIKKNPGRSTEKIETPDVVGAIIDLGNCLNLLDAKSIQVVEQAYDFYLKAIDGAGWPLPKNKDPDGSGDLLLRPLDCAVIQYLHGMREETPDETPPFNTVRGMFAEGARVYPGAGFHKKSHIQIAVRNPNCIKGYFRVLDRDRDWPIP
jgi:hypothetical protein